MRVFYTDHFVLPLPPGHRFPMAKYRMLRERVQGWGDERIRLEEPEAIGDGRLVHGHCPDYLKRVVSGRLSGPHLRQLGFPWSPALVERSRRSSGATYEGARRALEEGIAVNLAGGTHHAFRDRPEGFCVFNDSAVCALSLRREGRVRRVLIIDCDVHQGNGTAAILRPETDLFTFSIHGARNFPFAKEESDLDVGLPDGTGDAAFLSALDEGLWQAFDRARPELVIYLAGADPYRDDRLGRLAVSKQGLADRDRLVLDHCRFFGTPLVITMAGGYARRIEDTVDIHYRTVQLAADYA